MTKDFAAALALLPLFGVAIAMGSMFSSFMEATGRNPSASDKLTTMTYLAAAFIEALGLLSFLIAFMILKS